MNYNPYEFSITVIDEEIGTSVNFTDYKQFLITDMSGFSAGEATVTKTSNGSGDGDFISNVRLEGKVISITGNLIASDIEKTREYLEKIGVGHKSSLQYQDENGRNVIISGYLTKNLHEPTTMTFQISLSCDSAHWKSTKVNSNTFKSSQTGIELPVMLPVGSVSVSDKLKIEVVNRGNTDAGFTIGITNGSTGPCDGLVFLDDSGNRIFELTKKINHGYTITMKTDMYIIKSVKYGNWLSSGDVSGAALYTTYGAPMLKPGKNIFYIVPGYWNSQYTKLEIDTRTSPKPYKELSASITWCDEFLEVK